MPDSFAKRPVLPAPSLGSAGRDARISRALGGARYSRIQIAGFPAPPLHRAVGERPSRAGRGPAMKVGSGGLDEVRVNLGGDEGDAVYRCPGKVVAPEAGARPSTESSTETSTGRVETGGYPQGRVSTAEQQKCWSSVLFADSAARGRTPEIEIQVPPRPPLLSSAARLGPTAFGQRLRTQSFARPCRWSTRAVGREQDCRAPKSKA